MNRRRRRQRIPHRISMEQLIVRRRHMRAILMGLFFTVCLGLLMYRIWYYQTVWGDEYSQLVARQGARHQIGLVSRDIAPSRGVIMDRNMQPIASSHQVFTVSLDPLALFYRDRRDSRTGGDEPIDIMDDVLTAITFAFGVPRHQMDAWFDTDMDGNLISRSRHRVLATEVLPEVAVPLAELFPEIHARETSLRWHHDPFFAPQVLGFQLGDSAESYWGLERQFNRQLTGEYGRTIWIQGGEVEEVSVRDGYTLITTFDGDIQRLAQRHVDQILIDVPSEFIGLIVMNPHTGEILAMAQAPSFSMADPLNPRYFTDRELAERWSDLAPYQQTTEIMRLWRNFHVTRSSEPGSTFKPFVIAAAIEEGLINWNTTFLCEGVRIIHDQRVYCWDFTGHGWLNISEALYRSCNLVMVDINNQLRRASFYRYRGYFGFGGYTGIDLPGEFDVSSPHVMYPYHRLHQVEMATSSMGQGFNATSIQTITGYAALINGGNIMQPFFVSQIVDGNGNIVHEMPSEGVVVRRAISRDTSDQIRREMQLVVTETHATGRHLAIPGHAIGGKTGTAQQGERLGAYSVVSLTYVAFTPVENPEFLILMTFDHVVERGRHVTTGTFVSPRLRSFMEDLIRLRNLPPSEGDMAIGDWNIIMGAPTMPDFSGRSLREVVREINRADSGGFQVVGSGTVICHHFPAAGQSMPENVPIFFHMVNESRIDELMTFMPNVEGLPVEQAELMLQEVVLPSIRFTSARPHTDSGDFFPHTAHPSPITQEGYHEPPPPAPYIVYRQFPQAGTELEAGTQVVLRVR